MQLNDKIGKSKRRHQDQEKRIAQLIEEEGEGKSLLFQLHAQAKIQRKDLISLQKEFQELSQVQLDIQTTLGSAVDGANESIITMNEQWDQKLKEREDEDSELSDSDEDDDDEDDDDSELDSDEESEIRIKKEKEKNKKKKQIAEQKQNEKSLIQQKLNIGQMQRDTLRMLAMPLMIDDASGLQKVVGLLLNFGESAVRLTKVE
ncbi:MAG: hypothetical protein EZS28_003973 [Streblomastix strix]|uniref:Uncharacterized protein n=1 Tax=Streblomastix strix TaxID=222440 RepID=A0A5J4X1A4_9EUKA|nr:MAG: hypothetical protein EZS28_003973 [Streblomastix strix]